MHYLQLYIKEQEENKSLREALEVHRITLRDQFAMNAPINFLDAIEQCGYVAQSLTDKERTCVLSILALMRYEYADAMMFQRNVLKENK